MRKEGRQKRILASLLVFAMLVTMLPMNLFSGSTFKAKAEGEQTPASKNLVVNGDFEANTEGAEVSVFTGTSFSALGNSGWETALTSKTKGAPDPLRDDAVVSIIPEPGNESNHVVEIKNNSLAQVYVRQYLTENGGSKLGAGKTYVLTAYVKAVNLVVPDGEKTKTEVRMRMYFNEVEANSDWTKIQHYFTSSGNPNPKITLHFRDKSTSGSLLIDNVSVEEVISLDQQTMEIATGASGVLNAMVNKNLTAGDLVWTSSDNNVATVTADTENSAKAVVKAVGTEGQTATVTATLYKAGTTEHTEANVLSSASCAVTVKAPAKLVVNGDFEENTEGAVVSEFTGNENYGTI